MKNLEKQEGFCALWSSGGDLLRPEAFQTSSPPDVDPLEVTSLSVSEPVRNLSSGSCPLKTVFASDDSLLNFSPLVSLTLKILLFVHPLTFLNLLTHWNLNL
jgi:hypothetical protein